MTQSCLRLSRYRSIRIPPRSWLGLILVTGSLYSMLAHAQDEPNAQPMPTTTTTKAGQGIRPNKVATSYRRFNGGPTWADPAGLRDSMWGPAMDPPSRKETRWYGWQQMIPLLSADIVFVAIWANGSNVDAIKASLVFGPAVHIFAGPIVHWAHGHFDKSAAAFAMNLFIPAAAVPIGIIAAENDAIDFPLMVGFIGVSFVGVQAFDIAYLSKETVRVPLESSHEARTWLPSSVAILPMVDSNLRGLMFAGQF